MVAPVLESIFQAFDQRGSDRYGLEGVTQLQHALQSAQLAVQENAPPTQVAAALLHDIGHILEEGVLPQDVQQNLDDHHEALGYQFLKDHFGVVVADPVRLHVIAKRYLCTTQPDYIHQLSPTSLKSFHDQGGEMSAEEQQQFEVEPYFREAIQLRYWDDKAKSSSAQTPTLREFARYLEASLVTSC